MSTCNVTATIQTADGEPLRNVRVEFVPVTVQITGTVIVDDEPIIGVTDADGVLCLHPEGTSGVDLIQGLIVQVRCPALGLRGNKIAVPEETTAELVTLIAAYVNSATAPVYPPSLADVLAVGADADGIDVTSLGAIDATSDTTGVAAGAFEATAGNARGITATGFGTGYGVYGTGGATGGGIAGVGGATSGSGVEGVAQGGNGVGGYFVGNGSGSGVRGTGGGSDGVGVVGIGGATNGTGVAGFGTGTGAGVTGDATGGTGYGVIANADTTTPVRAALRIVPQDTDPSSGVQGDAYVNSSTGVLRRHDGSAWKDAGARYAEVAISSANITGTSSGQLGHANGYPLIAAQGTHKAIEVLSAVVINDFAGAAYTGGGNVSVNYAGGGSALTGAVTFANSIGAAADKVAVLQAAVPTNNQLAENTAVNLVAAAAPTQPGGATGVVRVKVSYRVHDTGL